VFSDFLEPLFTTDRFDSFQIAPKLDPVRHCRLKLFQVIAGILRAFNTEIDSPFRAADGYFAYPAIRPSLGRPAAVALDLFL
jgi:hypothetical protein